MFSRTQSSKKRSISWQTSPKRSRSIFFRESLKTPIYEQFKQEGRLLSEDWSQYNSKTAVAFKPKNMTTDELFDGYLRFRRRFFSLRSFVNALPTSLMTSYICLDKMPASFTLYCLWIKNTEFRFIFSITRGIR